MMEQFKPYISTTLFGLIFISFFLPFVGAGIFGFSISVSAFSLVFGFGDATFYFPVFLSFLCTIAGIVVSVVYKGQNRMPELILAAIIFVFLIITAIDINLSLKIGFFFMFIFSLGIIGYNVFELFLKGKVQIGTMTIKCPACGAIVNTTETFCSQCGAKLK